MVFCTSCPDVLMQRGGVTICFCTACRHCQWKIVAKPSLLTPCTLKCWNGLHAVNRKVGLRTAQSLLASSKHNFQCKMWHLGWEKAGGLCKCTQSGFATIVHSFFLMICSAAEPHQ